MDYQTEQQRTDKWFARRCGKPTASQYGAVLAKGRYGEEATTRRNYKADLLIERLTGRHVERFSSTSAMDWGTEMEEIARLQYEMQTGNTVRETDFVDHDFLPTGGSPDGLIDKDSWKRQGPGGMEIKSPNSAHHYEALKTNRVPAQYKPQIQGNLMLNPDRKWWDFVSFDPNYPPNAQLVIIRCYRDEEYIDNLLTELAIFIDELDEMEKFTREYKSNHKRR